MRFQRLAIALAVSVATESASAAFPWGVTYSISSGRTFGIPQHRQSLAAVSSSTASISVLSVPRGGADSTAIDAPAERTAEPADVDTGEGRSLEEKVREAMKKYGLDPDAPPAAAANDEDNDDVHGERNCEGGVCEIPRQEARLEEENGDVGPMEPQTEEDINAMADRITSELEVDRQIVLAALGATATGEGDQRRVDEALARELILAERDAISGVTEDCEEVCCILYWTIRACLCRDPYYFFLLHACFNPKLYCCFHADNQVSCGILSHSNFLEHAGTLLFALRGKIYMSVYYYN